VCRGDQSQDFLSKEAEPQPVICLMDDEQWLGRVTRSGWRPSAGIVAVDICAQVGSVPYPMATPEDLAQTVQEVSALGRRRAESSAPSTDKPR
jgi:hypothetical protein